MKKKIISLMIAVLAAGAFVSCSDWTEPEARDFTQHKPASYYENLRAWKADKSHPIAFGWFGGWDPTGATTATSLMGIPDSVSLVANWATFSLTPEQMEEVVQVKKLKGTDVVVTILLTNVVAKATPEAEQNEADYLKAYYFVEETKVAETEEETEGQEPVKN